MNNKPDFTFKNEVDLLGLTLNEKRVLMCISKYSKTYVLIASHTKIPRTTVIYTLEKLCKRGFVTERKNIFNKKCWKSNLSKVLNRIKFLQNQKDENSPLFELMRDLKFKDDPDSELNSTPDELDGI